MWYSDPFIALPVLWGSLSILAFIAMIIVAKAGWRWTARLLAAVFASSAAATGFALAFGYYLRNYEEVDKWIGIM